MSAAHGTGMTTPNDTSRIGVPRPTGNADNRRDQQSIDLLDDSPATVTGVVVRNQTLPTRSRALAAAVALGGLVWLVTPALGGGEEPNQTLEPSSQQTTLEAKAVPEHAAGSAVASPFALVAQPAVPSVVDRVASEARRCQLITGEPTSDQAFPLGAPHE